MGMRIVSLLPSATDIVYSLGLGDSLVGRTHECDWPMGIGSVPVVTADRLATASMSSREIDRAVGSSVHSGSSIYTLDHDALAAARPDLIITQELCDVCAVSYREVSAAARMLEGDVRVVSLEPRSIDDILAHVELVGSMTGAEAVAEAIVQEARSRLDDVRRAVDGRPRVRTFCVEWLDPIYAAGHWVPEQVEIAGGEEVLGIPHQQSRPLNWEAVLEASPDALVLLPCGLSIERALAEIEVLARRPGWSDLPAVRNGNVTAVDGPSYFNRPGPRVVRGVEVLAWTLHGAGRIEATEAVRLRQ